MSMRDKVRERKKGEHNQEEKRQKTSATRETLQEKKRSHKKEYFLREKMWISYLVSMMQKDRGKIPDNIGNRMLISNNMYITKPYMSSMLQIVSLSLQTPQALISEILQELRDKKSSAIVDVTIKNENFDVQLQESGLLSRIAMWEKSMDSDVITDREKEMAARCLYTVDIAKEGKRLLKSRIYLTVRHKTGSELTRAERIICNYLASKGAVYRLITDVAITLRYVSLVSDYRDKALKDVKTIVNSEQTLAQLLPNSSSWNDKKGHYLGVNILNNTQFLLDFEKITSARNLYILAPSGVGKTVLALNLVCSAVENNWAVCVQDIKGNEFTYFIQSTGGYIVSLRQMSPGFINSFVMRKDDTTDSNAETYFNTRIAFSKKQLIILSGVTTQEYIIDLEELLDEFLDSLYISLGVLPNNRNTWKNTQNLTPFCIYDSFVDYMTPTMQNKYSSIARKVLSAYRMYMSEGGSKSYIFKTEFDYSTILRANTLMFDFGILEGQHNNVDQVLFRLRFSYMQNLNAEFVSYKYSKGIKVLKILEESQIAVNDLEIMRGYVEEYTLRRAQGQTTVMLGNSISALTSNPISKPLIENVKGILIGKLPRDAREEAIRTFDLEDKREVLESIGEDEEHANTFLFVNNMQTNSLTALLKIILDKDRKYKLITPVARQNEMSI